MLAEQVDRALIVRTSHLGDVAQTMALAHGLRRRWPDIELGWVVQEEFAPLIEPLARPLLFERRGGARAWPRLRRAMRAFGPQLTLDAQGNWKSAFAARLSGAPALGFARDERQEPMAGTLLRIRAVGAAPGPRRRHLVDRIRSLLGAVTGDDVPPGRDPCLTPAESAAGAALLGQLLADAGRPDARPVLLHPGVPGDPRTWPAERFGALARALSARDELAPIVLTGPGEAEVGRALETALADAPGVAHLVGQRGLRDLAALLAAARGRGGALAVSDSGPAHVAAAVELPVHLIAGPEDPSATGPWPVVSTAGSPHLLTAPPHAWPAIAAGTLPWTPRPVERTGVRDVLSSILSGCRSGSSSGAPAGR